jgi:hypothetical protein
VEAKEYRKQETEFRVRVGSAVTAALSAADLLSGTFVLDHVQTAAVDLPWHGGATTLAAAAAAAVASYWTRHRRTSDKYHRSEVLHANQWAGHGDLRASVGLSAARRSAARSRPDLTAWDRRRANAASVGITLGRTVSGTGLARGRKIVVPWESGSLLVLGEPGSGKSTHLAGIVAQAPGAQVVVSTKDELMAGTWEARSGRGPVAAFCPLGWSDLPEGVRPFAWSLVAGCRDPRVAQRQATALMSASATGGLAAADFWTGKGRAVLTALLVAADLKGEGLKTLARWLQEGKYEEAANVLTRHPEEVEETMVSTLRQMVANPGDKTATSVSHTASAVLEFLQDGQIARALDAPRDQAVDLQEFVQAGGTLYLVTDNSPALAPLMAAMMDSVVEAAKRVAMKQGQGERSPRLRTPLVLVVDEMDKTLPGVPLDKYVAELRGWGIFTVGATQNRARIVKEWGRESADALCNSMQFHLVLSINSAEDRAYYETRIGPPRRVEHVQGGEKGGASSLRSRLTGRSHKSASVEIKQVPLWDAHMWSFLPAGHGVVVPTKGACAVVNIGNGWRIAEKKGAAVLAEASSAARKAARQAEATELAAAHSPVSESDAVTGQEGIA